MKKIFFLIQVCILASFVMMAHASDENTVTPNDLIEVVDAQAVEALPVVEEVTVEEVSVEEVSVVEDAPAIEGRVVIESNPSVEVLIVVEDNPTSIELVVEEAPIVVEVEEVVEETPVVEEVVEETIPTVEEVIAETEGDVTVIEEVISSEQTVACDSLTKEVVDIVETVVVNEVTDGALVTGVLQKGDILVSIEHKGTVSYCTRMFIVVDYMLKVRPGDQITVTFIRNGVEMKHTFTLESKHFTNIV